MPYTLLRGVSVHSVEELFICARESHLVSFFYIPLRDPNKIQ
jgi:hypothetical protein